MKHLLTIALMLLLWSCQDDLAHSVPDGGGVEAPYVVIRLAIPSMSGETRANPMGGEEGNGREKALANEDEIHDINVFFYNEADDEADESDRKGLDGTDDTPIFHSIYFNLDDPSDPANAQATPNDETNPYLGVSYIELKFKTTTPLPDLKEGTNFAVIANIGKLESVPATLGALRDLDLSSYCSYGPDRFLMSTAFNLDYKYYYGRSTGTNSLLKEKDIYKGATTLQRLAARIDLWYNAEKNAGIADNDAEATVSKLTYDVEGHSGDKVMLLNALPVNVMQSPSFLFKKVSAQTLTQWTKSALQDVTSFFWAGQETPQGVPTSAPEDCPTNYVFERHTLDKVTEASSAEGETLSEWYGTTCISSVKSEIRDSEKGKMAACLSVKALKGGHDPDYGCDRISVIAYAEENIQPTDCFRKEYLTGLIFRAAYVPQAIYQGIEEEGGNLIPLTPEEITEFDTAKKLYRYSPTTSRNGLAESKDLVFAGRTLAMNYLAAHPEDNAEVTEFGAVRVDGALGLECFYSLWLRHYNDENADPQADYPMEYAIVRNNIYRVALEFSGPGTPEPEMREPDTMMSRIFVRKWNLREESNPLQF